MEKLNEQHQPVADIARQLGVPEGTVRAVLDRRSYRRAVVARGTEVAGAVLDDEKVAELRRLHSEGASRKQLSSKFGITIPHVIGIVKGTGWQHVDRAVTDATLTPEQVLNIRTRHRNGATRAELAVEYGHTAVTIGKIIRGEAFRDIGGPISTEENPFRPKLTGPQAARLIREYVDGEPIARLAKKYELNEETVRGLVRPFADVRAVWRDRER